MIKILDFKYNTKHHSLSIKFHIKFKKLLEKHQATEFEVHLADKQSLQRQAQQSCFWVSSYRWTTLREVSFVGAGCKMAAPTPKALANLHTNLSPIIVAFSDSTICLMFAGSKLNTHLSTQHFAINLNVGVRLGA